MTPNHPDRHKLLHPDTTNDKTWRTRAACRNIPPTHANWFPEQHHAHDPQTKNAYQICNKCPVKNQCLYDALTHDKHKETGIYGGLPPRQRHKLRAQLVAEGHLQHQRTCTNPQCRTTYPAPPTTPHQHNLCTNCKRTRRPQHHTRQCHPKGPATT